MQYSLRFHLDPAVNESFMGPKSKHRVYFERRSPDQHFRIRLSFRFLIILRVPSPNMISLIALSCFRIRYSIKSADVLDLYLSLDYRGWCSSRGLEGLEATEAENR
jgi:hypothetical protein